MLHFPIRRQDALHISLTINVTQIVLKTDRRFLIQDGFPDRYDQLIETLCSVVTEEADASVHLSGWRDAMTSESDRFFSISNDLDELIPYFPHLDNSLRDASHAAFRQSTTLRENVRSGRDNEQPSGAIQRSSASSPVIDLERLFSDL